MTATVSDGINAKILAALAKIPDQISQCMNNVLPEHLNAALAESLIAVGKRMDELETTTNSLRDELKNKTEHLQSKISDMSFNQQKLRSQAIIDHHASSLRISNIYELCKITTDEINDAGFYSTELVCSRFDRLMEEVGAYRLYCDSINILPSDNRNMAIVRFSSVSKASRAKMLIINYLSSEAGKQTKCYVDICLPLSSSFKRIERPVRQLMDTLKSSKHIRHFHIDSVINNNRASSEAGTVRPRIGVVLGDGKKLRSVIPDSVLYIDGSHSSSHRLVLNALIKDIPGINIDATLELVMARERRAAELITERSNKKTRSKQPQRGGRTGERRTIVSTDDAAVAMEVAASPAKRSSSRSSEDSLEPPTKARPSTPAVPGPSSA